MGGNINVPGMINCIIQASLQLKINTENEDNAFRQIHIFHTEESLERLIISAHWREALEAYNISSTSLTHHVTQLENSSIERFRDMLEQLRTIINPTENAYYYVDLTGGISSLKAILAVFSYVLDVENIYTLETDFSDDYAIKNKQKSMFYKDLQEEIRQGRASLSYKKFPPIRDFDRFGKLNYTEILRYRRTISSLMEHLNASLNSLICTETDLSYLQTSFLSGVNSRLIGEAQGNLHDHQNAIYAFSHGIEEIANIIILTLKGSEIKDKTLGNKLQELRSFFSDKPQYFVTENILSHFTELMVELRNRNIHYNDALENSSNLEIQASLASYLAFSFLKFTIKIFSEFVDNTGNFLEVKIIDISQEESDEEFYFGFDGDGTGNYIGIALGDLIEDEEEVLRRSNSVSASIKKISTLITSTLKNQSAVIFAEGDNVLFKGKYSQDLIRAIQDEYTVITGLSSSIGFGKTLKEATIALRLAKARKGNSVIGVNLGEEK